MSFTPSSDQKKSLAFSLLIYTAMVLILFFIRFWPPSNLAELTGGGGGGVSVNFGDSDLGSGSNYKSEVLEVQNQVKETPTAVTPDEAVIAQENTTEESVVIPKKEKTEQGAIEYLQFSNPMQNHKYKNSITSAIKKAFEEFAGNAVRSIAMRNANLPATRVQEVLE